jgi:hypothetical protein
MTKELKDKLYVNYQGLFSRKDLPMSQTCMCWGIEVGDGWYNLIDELCSKLVALHPNIRADQVKEKYGTLRFYISSEGKVPATLMDKAYDLEDEYETKSSTICEECGNVGLLRGNGWLRTLCDAHATAMGYGPIEDMP